MLSCVFLQMYCTQQCSYVNNDVNVNVLYTGLASFCQVMEKKPFFCEKPSWQRCSVCRGKMPTLAECTLNNDSKVGKQSVSCGGTKVAA